MPRIPTPASIEAAPAAAQPLLAAVKKQLGIVPNMFRAISNSPAALEGYLGLNGALAKGTLEAPTRERIHLMSAAISSGVCIASPSTAKPPALTTATTTSSAHASVGVRGRPSRGRRSSPLRRRAEDLDSVQAGDVTQPSRVDRGRFRDHPGGRRPSGLAGKALETARCRDLERAQRRARVDEEAVRESVRQEYDVTRTGCQLVVAAEEAGRAREQKKTSSSSVCRCIGGANPGGLRNSTTESLPSVCDPATLTVTRLPRNHNASPAPSATC